MIGPFSVSLAKYRSIIGSKLHTDSSDLDAETEFKREQSIVFGVNRCASRGSKTRIQCRTTTRFYRSAKAIHNLMAGIGASAKTSEYSKL